MAQTVDRQAQFPALHALQLIDNEILELIGQRRAAIQDVKTLDAEHAREVEKRDELREAHKRAQVEHATRDNELETEQAKLDRYKEQLRTARDANEYKAFERQIETTTGRISDMEELTIELMLAIDEAKETLDAGEATFDAYEADYKAKRRDIARQVKALDDQLTERKTARANQANDVDPSLLDDYTKWRASRKTTMLATVKVVEIMDRGIRVVTYSCDECGMNIPPQKILEAQTHAGRHICPSCFRLLWPPEPVEEEVETEAE